MITVVYCTRKSNREHYDHIRKTSGLANKIEVIEIVNNGESLTKAYNRGLKQATNDIVVFCHDDIFFNKNGWGRKLIKNFETTDYGILGIAGTTDLDVSGQWWADKSKMVGIVKHSHLGKTFESKYSGNFVGEIIETVAVDGLFFAVHKDRIKEDFDESVEGFHFYEIDFCFRNHLAGVKVGVTFEVKLTHKSIGQTNDKWEINRKLFAEKFSSNLPKKIKVKPEYNFEDIQLKKTPNLKIFMSSSGEKRLVNERLEEIKQCGYDNYSVSIIAEEDSVGNIKELETDKVKVFEGSFPTLHKNLSVLRWDDEFINDKDELVMFLSDDVSIKTNVIKKFISIYLKDNNFGCAFPRIVNRDETILSTGIHVTLIGNEKNETQVKYHLKGMNSYYSYSQGYLKEPLGNLGFCFMTTYSNLLRQGWFRLDYEEFLYESDFATKCSLDNKNVYVDNDSVVQLSYVFSKDQDFLNILNKDFNTLIGAFKEMPKSIDFMEKMYVPSQQKQQQ
tara:strand:+ start:198 stop:1709 length:1512 start_codon:yes stop_codon:yes gene_type:complete